MTLQVARTQVDLGRFTQLIVTCFRVDSAAAPKLVRSSHFQLLRVRMTQRQRVLHVCDTLAIVFGERTNVTALKNVDELPQVAGAVRSLKTSNS